MDTQKINLNEQSSKFHNESIPSQGNNNKRENSGRKTFMFGVMGAVVGGIMLYIITDIIAPGVFSIFRDPKYTSGFLFYPALKNLPTQSNEKGAFVWILKSNEQVKEGLNINFSSPDANTRIERIIHSYDGDELTANASDLKKGEFKAKSISLRANKELVFVVESVGLSAKDLGDLKYEIQKILKDKEMKEDYFPLEVRNERILEELKVFTPREKWIWFVGLFMLGCLFGIGIVLFFRAIKIKIKPEVS